MNTIVLRVWKSIPQTILYDFLIEILYFNMKIDILL